MASWENYCLRQGRRVKARMVACSDGSLVGALEVESSRQSSKRNWNRSVESLARYGEHRAADVHHRSRPVAHRADRIEDAIVTVLSTGAMARAR